ncbi:hypothetical protein QBC47DRAFT_362428 [Echria macrotheca]|uniref:Uncharacterized protein n=1 Tax=Echria macrotheca TaxID=438768 RepID=A0AAJ0F9V6_9PEZI|nr:hypothetical protein QBC47DRAFT_362428 [Echria macrotheca]
MTIFPYDREAPLMGIPIETVVFHTPRPICRCVTFYQFYLCGCPDMGYDRRGCPIRTFSKCEVYFMPVSTQLALQRLGWQHNDEVGQVPHEDVPRILPFPCFRHSQICRVRISADEVKRMRKTFLAGRRQQARLGVVVSVRECRVNRAAAMRRARQQAFCQHKEDCQDKTERKRAEEAWWRDEWETDHYTQDRAPGAVLLGLWDRGNPHYPRYGPPRNTGYDNGADVIDDRALEQARLENWGPVGVWEVNRNGTMEPWRLHM